MDTLRILTTLTLSCTAALLTMANAQFVRELPPLHTEQHTQLHAHKSLLNIQPMQKATPLFKADTLSVTVVGDVMMHTLQIQHAKRADGTFDFSDYFSLIEDKIGEADIAVANMEFTLAGEPYTGYPCFSAPDSFGTYLAKTGFDIFLCANNHIFDKGGTGASRTLEIYDMLHRQYGILHTGLRRQKNDTGITTDNPLIVLRKGIRLAFVNFTYGTNSYGGTNGPQVNRLTDKKLLKTTLNQARYADFTFAFPHWGIEYNLRHSASQRQDAEFMVREGADIIIGSHPHVVQDMEQIDGVSVIYSLGNAVSNMSATNTQVELMVKVSIIRSENGDLRMEEPEFTWLWCSRPGGFSNGYTLIPIEEFIGKRDLWSGKWDYDKMISSWKRVTAATRIGAGCTGQVVNK